MSDQVPITESTPLGFHPFRLVLVVLGVLLVVFQASGWYAGQVAVPRYCEQQELMLQHLVSINTQKRPAGENSRRNYIVAAKLEFLLPRMADEPVDVYVTRLRTQLEERCR